MKHEVFALRNITVKNAYTTYLDSFSMHVFKGETLGIICDDFNEKTALLSIFEGEYPVPAKNVRFDDKSKKNTVSVRQFKKYFSVIGTEIKTHPDFSVIDNMLMTPDKPFILLNRKRTRAMAESLLKELEADIPLDCPVSELTAAEKYSVELIRAFVQKKKIVVLTNMNDRFNASELWDLFTLMDNLKERGITFLIMLDTPDKNLTSYTEELLILKNGRSIAQIGTAIFHFSELYNYMLTGSIDTPAIHTMQGFADGNEDFFDEESDDPVVTFDKVSTLNFEGLDFCLYSGELLKIISMDQKSIDAVKNLVTGKDSVLGGSILVHERTLTSQSLRNPVDSGIYWCPQGPYRRLLFDNLSMIDNLMLGPMTKAEMNYISEGLVENQKDYCEKHFTGIDYNRPVKELSNKIRQELVFHKILMLAPRLVFIEKPFEESILGMNETTIQMIHTLLRRGICVVILSMSTADAAILEGDTLYMKNGKMIDEMEMYAQRY